jgi:hypothetical protein
MFAVLEIPMTITRTNWVNVCGFKQNYPIKLVPKKLWTITGYVGYDLTVQDDWHCSKNLKIYYVTIRSLVMQSTYEISIVVTCYHIPVIIFPTFICFVYLLYKYIDIEKLILNPNPHCFIAITKATASGWKEPLLPQPLHSPVGGRGKGGPTALKICSIKTWVTHKLSPEAYWKWHF